MTGLHRTALAAAETRAHNANRELLRVLRARAEGRATEADVIRVHAARTEAEGDLYGVVDRIAEAEALGRPVLTIPGLEQAEKIRAAASRAPVRLVK